MTTMQKPINPCRACGANNWWLTSDGRYLCGRCHPNPNPEEGESLPEMVVVSDQPGESHLVPVSPGKKDYSPEVLALRDRVKAGNDKLTKAWLQILDIVDNEERFQQDERWHKARDKLGNLCLELQAKGYEECLYMENGKKVRSCLSNPENHWCWVCPSKRKYWEEELEEL